MGADFICGVLAIKRGKVPNFEKAKKFIDKMKDEDLIELMSEHTEKFDLEADKLNVEEAKKILYAVWETIKEGWSGHHRSFCCFDHPQLNATLLVAGEKTWGDPVEEVSAMELFHASGMAKAAGFM